MSFIPKKIHLIGIGGIGMSGLAQLLLAHGAKVSGSDLKSSRLTERLKYLGAQIYIGHSAANIKEADLVIYTPAIKADNPELLKAKSCAIKLLSRAEALAQLANQKNSIAVTGAHGKTTTSSLISHLLARCGHKPTICVGGELFSLDGNTALLGEGDYFVLEADESDGSFLSLQPLYSVVTNIDREHLDYYQDLRQIIQTFRKFMNNTKESGCVFFCQDDPELVKIARCLQKKVFSFGLKDTAGIFAQNLRLKQGGSIFSCIYHGRNLGEITLKIPGRHNISNALGAIAVGLELGLDFKSIQQALFSFNGVRRRMELRSKEKGILIFEDYAHHPTEIRATLEALRSFGAKRILAVFQPHRYTRTRFLMDDFGRCFSGADYLIVTDIYAASEAPIAGVSAKEICRRAKEAKVKRVRFLPKEKILNNILREAKSGDLVAIMGAGDIGGIADALVEEIKRPGTP